MGSLCQFWCGTIQPEYLGSFFEHAKKITREIYAAPHKTCSDNLRLPGPAVVRLMIYEFRWAFCSVKNKLLERL
jgi:hypothetical protein